MRSPGLRVSATGRVQVPPHDGHARIGMSTQFVVGPAGESDRDLLSTAQMLYREIRLARAYYSAFTPVRDTPLEGEPPTDPQREFRLYQADWLLRYYHFSADELPFDADGQLRTDLDPKTAWARNTPNASRWRSTPRRWTSCCGCPVSGRPRPGRLSGRGGRASCARSVTCASWAPAPTGPRPT